jgi:hypothetical protein
MKALQEDWQVLLQLFPPNWESLARSTGAVTRLRGFNSVEDLLRSLLLHVGSGLSLRETAVHAKLAGIAEVSDVTLMTRLQQAEEWFRQLCQLLWLESGVSLQPTVPIHRVRLIDATQVKEPGKTGSLWRIHYSLRLPRLECDHVELTPAQGKNTGENLGRFTFEPGELILADAGYSRPPGIARVVDQGAHLCVRLNPTSVPLLDKRGKPFLLLERLKTITVAGRIKDWPVQAVCQERKIAGRLCLVRKSDAVIEKVQRRIDRKQKRQKTKGTPESRLYACYVIVFTTLPTAEVSARQVLESYRVRWQIELTFKRLKSIVELGHVPKTDDTSTRAWLYGKLFVALLSEKLARVGETISPWGYYLPESPTNP